MSKQMVGFRASEEYLKKIEQLSEKLGLDFSNTVRLSVDKMLEKHLGTKEEILLIDDVKFNLLVGKGLDLFLNNFGAYMASPKLMAEFTEFIKVVTSKVAPKGAVQADAIDITEGNLSEWVDECVKNDATFETKDVNPQVEKVKKAILTTVRRLKGRID